MRKQAFESGCFYHIYNRGVMRHRIFYTDANWLFFLQRVRKYCRPDLSDVVAYCLMPNHYHLILLSHTSALGTEVMQPLVVSYTKAINREQNRVGPLFQGPFAAKRVVEDNQLLQLTAYVHLNPVWAGLVREPEDWMYSSYRDYAGLRVGTLPKTCGVLSHFASRQDHVRFVTEYKGTRPALTGVTFQQD